ncbi:MAG: hypothetical protein DMG32_07270 [Acidobacteria bacterium]|nr:MAG: hypothetical protein DMG32_07270 [Acidobacteriota bacterium]
MSINSMANAAIGRRPDYEPLQGVPKSLREISKAASGASAPENQVTSALNVIVAYIPTEILTLYVAVLAVLGNAKGLTVRPTMGTVITFWSFFLATPATVWILYAVKLKTDNKSLPLTPVKWPIWEMVAGTVGYAAWAMALPDNPFIDAAWYSSGLAGVIVLVSSTFLGLIAPLFQQPLTP